MCTWDGLNEGYNIETIDNENYVCLNVREFEVIPPNESFKFSYEIDFNSDAK